MSVSLPTKEEFTHGVVCALPKERLAVWATLDHEFDRPHPRQAGDHNVYVLGSLHTYNVVICSLPDGEYGKVHAAQCGKDLMRTYTGIKYLFFVGIAGACPDPLRTAHAHDIRLGDVATSSSGVQQYDLGKYVDGQLIPKGHLNMPSQYMRQIVSSLLSKLKLNKYRQVLRTKLKVHIDNIVSKLEPGAARQYARPSDETDLLFPAEFKHPTASTDCKRICTAQCAPLGRAPRTSFDSFEIFSGLIGCGDRVIKDAQFRDKLMKQDNVLCFEMEAAGITQLGDYLIIRGMCDYADSHKNKHWQEYACAAAAAVFNEIMFTASQGEARHQSASTTAQNPVPIQTHSVHDSRGQRANRRQRNADSEEEQKREEPARQRMALRPPVPQPPEDQLRALWSPMFEQVARQMSRIDGGAAADTNSRSQRDEAGAPFAFGMERWTGGGR